MGARSGRLSALARHSHGSLHANDSNAVLIWTGTGPEKSAREQWALRDITPMALSHFGVSAE